MAFPPSKSSFTFLPYSCLSLILISFFLKGSHALEEKQVPTPAESSFFSVDSSTLMPSLTCKSSVFKGPSGKSTLRVVDKHGACNEGASNKLTLAQILQEDQSRVASIQSRHTFGSKTDKVTDKKTSIPGKSGASLGSGNYVATVGLGTPKKYYNLIFDTGSDLTWTQCKPCIKFCYPQNDPIFNPLQSSTYSNVSCTSAQCALLTAGTGNMPGCSGLNCVYGIQYGDNSFSVGFFAKDTLAIGKDVFPGFLFGCGQNNQGLFGKTDGLIGLGRSQISLVSQTAKKYGKVFSYCLPTSSGSNGYLSFGKGGISKKVKFTPFSASRPNRNFYFVDITGIKVGGQLLPISASVFQTAGTIVDSGTVITRLPPAAYLALKTTFKQQMTKYKPAPAFSILDTCYDFTGLRSITIPKVSFNFKGNANVDLGINGVFVAVSISQVCLAFAGNGAATDLGIFGNIQQQTQQVVYDVAGGRLGFGAGGCS